MRYTRHNPSPRYRYLSEQYRQLHAEGDPRVGIATHRMFSGHSLFPWVERIRELVQRTGAKTVLDYGSGKGQQYDPLDRAGRERLGGADSVMDYWGVDEVRCYDPFYEPYSGLPEERFDAVVCTDVLEHCPEEDVGWILEEVFGYASKFVFAVVACYPAEKKLPDGSNAHCTIRAGEWWRVQVDAAALARPVDEFEIVLVGRDARGPVVQRLTRNAG